MSTPSLSLASYPLICLHTNPSTLPQVHPGGQPHNLSSTGQHVNTRRIPLPSPLHLFIAEVEATSLGGLVILMALTSMGTTSSSLVTRGTMVRAYTVCIGSILRAEDQYGSDQLSFRSNARNAGGKEALRPRDSS
jgi:hypothetical protein